MIEADEVAAEQEFLSVSWFQWLGGGVVALWIALFTMVQRKLNQAVTREEIDNLVDNVNEKFVARREAVEQRLGDLEKRQDRFREDLKDTEERLTTEIHNSEIRLIAAFRSNRD